jgi:hypothetical protein
MGCYHRCRSRRLQTGRKMKITMNLNLERWDAAHSTPYPDGEPVDTEPCTTAGGGCVYVVKDTDQLRRSMIETGQPQADLAEADQTWTTEQLRAEFDVLGFQAPFVIARRKADDAVGSLEFTHQPRVYFGWVEDQSS